MVTKSKRGPQKPKGRRDGKPTRAEKRAKNKAAFQAEINKINESHVPPLRFTGTQNQYTPELAESIMDMVSQGHTLTGACRILDVHIMAVRRWLADDIDGLMSRYARAKDLQFEAWEDEQVELADNVPPDAAHVAKVKLQSDNRRWLMGKLKIGKYGDKVQHQGGDPSAPIRLVHDKMTPEEAARAYEDIVKGRES